MLAVDSYSTDESSIFSSDSSEIANEQICAKMPLFISFDIDVTCLYLYIFIQNIVPPAE